MLAPLSCTNMQVGVIREDYQSLNYFKKTKEEKKLVEVVHQFRTTTPRNIGIKLDMNRGQLRFWLNDNFIPAKFVFSIIAS